MATDNDAYPKPGQIVSVVSGRGMGWRGEVGSVVQEGDRHVVIFWDPDWRRWRHVSADRVAVVE